MRLLSTLIFVVFTSGCGITLNDEPSRHLVSESDLIFLFETINISKHEDFKIHVVIEEYLNDNSLLINVQQHGVDMKDIRAENEYMYEGMKVFVHTEMMANWVPDSYFRRFLLRYNNGLLMVDSLGVLPAYKFPEGYEYDSTYQVISEDDLM